MDHGKRSLAPGALVVGGQAVARVLGGSLSISNPLAASAPLRVAQLPTRSSAAPVKPDR